MQLLANFKFFTWRITHPIRWRRFKKLYISKECPLEAIWFSWDIGPYCFRNKETNKFETPNDNTLDEFMKSPGWPRIRKEMAKIIKAS